MSRGTLFGTDGIRGLAGRSPLSPSDVTRLGFIAGSVLRRHVRTRAPRVLIVRDTRLSGPALLRVLSSGLRRAGVVVYDGGVMGTPAAAFLVGEHRFDSAVVISASHNPPEFNGIKFFNRHGRKWPDTWEAAVERLYAAGGAPGAAVSSAPVVDASALIDDYADFLAGTIGGGAPFRGLRIAMDCSHGANSALAPALYRRLGAEVSVIGARPTGRNINVGCGSQHPEKLSALVRRSRCHVGVAFDGDGDRVIMVDEKGAVLDGDHVIGLLARHLKGLRRLRANTVVITVMANLGLKKALGSMGVRTVETPVGDRHVSSAMAKTGAALGGEQSGHIILGEYLPTGDGLLTSLHVLAAMRQAGRPLSRLSQVVKKFPQILINVPVRDRRPIDQLHGVPDLVRATEKRLGADGRVLIRYSGTEPLLRVMIEGPNQGTIRRDAEQIAGAVRSVNGR